MPNKKPLQLISLEFAEDPAAYLKDELEKRGLSVSEVCNEAGIDRSTIEYWKKKVPQTVELLANLQRAIDKLGK